MTAHQVVVMGVSGCGKSTVGELLAHRLGADFLDGDSLHPQENIDKMAAGTPLDDADREPWLLEIGRSLAASGGESRVVACSALKRAYRDIIRRANPTVHFVHLHGDEDLLAARMAVRPGHFMPTSLLRSQLRTLEPLDAAEPGTVLDIAEEPARLARRAEEWLTGRPAARSQ